MAINRPSIPPPFIEPPRAMEPLPPLPQPVPPLPEPMLPRLGSTPPYPTSRRRWWLVPAAVLAGGVAIAVITRHGPSGQTEQPKQAVARIKLGTSAGTGFFVRGPDDLAYVVTAYHVIESGEPIEVERMVDGEGAKPFVEAYPEVEVAAFDADADLAVLRVTNVRADHFPVLALGDAPTQDSDIASYGFAASSLSRSPNLMSKPGKVLSLVKFPIYDHDSGTLIRDDAVDGLLVSSEIEPGFSGGPTCNTRGEVVGVNVTKDLVHRAQNGAVSVSALRALLDKVKPAAASDPVRPEDVKALLTRIESEYLLLPLDKRATARESDYVSTRDLPRVTTLVSDIDVLQHDTTRDPKTKLSGQAVLGVLLMRLPGHPLETFTAPATRQAVADCELREQRLQEYFGALHGSEARTADHAPCLSRAFRPMVWDLTALAMQWEGAVRDIKVVKVESTDDEHHEYRASVQFANLSYLVDVWLSTEGGRLRLKLFDNHGAPSGVTTPRAVPASAFVGTWLRTEPKTSRSFPSGFTASFDTDEKLTLSVGTDGTVSATHALRRHIYRDGQFLPCGNGSFIDLGIEQNFTGAIDHGAVVAFRQGKARAIGRNMATCSQAFTYQPDQVAVFKLVDGKLLMYRSDGTAFPETAEFHAAPAAAQ
jgi:hypothetical protein